MPRDTPSGDLTVEYEVEQKFPIDDAESLRSKLSELSAAAAEPVEQVDTYFSHPARDFAQTDEALRVREFDSRCTLTYKGPKIDDHTKTRQEIKIALPSQEHDARQIASLLEALGFLPVAQVRKTREVFRLQWDSRPLVVALDEVASLGSFLEIESMARQHDLDAARDAVQSLAERLGVDASERRSYLELILGGV